LLPTPVAVLAGLRTAPRKQVHGVMLEVYGLGVLLTGEAGIGKSALALELISRGHALVADDAVEFVRPAAGVLIGRCPPLLSGYLEVRGAGVLDIGRMHGESAVRPAQRLDLVVRLGRRSRRRALQGARRVSRLLGEPVPGVSLAAGTGDNLAVRVEAACRDHWLRLAGVRADAVFAERQQRAILK
jgi:HPr kinase/phosphorylase